MSDNRKIARNTIFLYVRMFLIMGVSLYTSRVILRVLGVDDFGIYNAVGGIVAMFTFVNGSLSAATSRYLTYELGRGSSSRLNEVFSTALVIHVLLAVFIVALSETLGLWFLNEKMIIPNGREEAASVVYQLSILTCFFSMTQVPYNAMIIAHENMSVYAYVGIFEAFAKLLIAWSLSCSPIDRLVFYAALLCLLQVSVMLFYRFYCKRRFVHCHFKLYMNSALYREMFVYASSDMIGQLSLLAQGQGLNLLLNLFFGPVVNAARAIAYQVQGIVNQFASNFMMAVRPQIIKLYADGRPDEMMRLVQNSSKLSYFLMWLIAFPIVLEAEYLLKLWLGEFPDHTLSFLRLVLMLCLIQTLKTPRSTVFHATGHIRRVNFTVGTILCCTLPLGYLLLKLGCRPESVFWSSIAMMLLSELVSVVILKRYIAYSATKYLMNVHCRCAAVSAISVILTLIFRDYVPFSGFVRFVFTCFLTTISSVLTMWLVGLGADMRRKIRTYFKKRFSRYGR